MISALKEACSKGERDTCTQVTVGRKTGKDIVNPSRRFEPKCCFKSLNQWNDNACESLMDGLLKYQIQIPLLMPVSLELGKETKK